MLIIQDPVNTFQSKNQAKQPNQPNVVKFQAHIEALCCGSQLGLT